MVQVYVSRLTSNEQRCVLPHTPSASCEPEPKGSGRLSWSRAHHGTETNAGTGNDAQQAGLPEAAQERSRKKKKLHHACFTHHKSIQKHMCLSARGDSVSTQTCSASVLFY